MASSRPLPPPEVETRLRAQFGDDVVAFEDSFGHPVVTISSSRYRELMTFLRDEPEFVCDYCDFTSGVDRGDAGIEIVTNVFSTTLHHNVRVKVVLPADGLLCPTISDIYPAANWHERE
ncbi:MAG: NADH-quinone oxidoreductase subunit C, partial [Actinomycetota bacterium]